MPHIEAEYRTAPFRVLVGHSFGGLFTVHAFLTRPESFRAYVAVSPSLMWDDRALIRRAREELPTLPLHGRFLYMTAGDQEMGDMLGGLRAFAGAVEAADPEGLRWWYRVMPDESHPSVVHRTAYDGLEAIFRPYRLTEPLLVSGDVEAVEARLAEASRALGYEIPVPEGVLNTMGYMQLQFAQRPERAVEIFRRAVELYPSSANAYDSLADGLEAAGRLDEALENREVAVRRAEEIGDPRLETFRGRRDELREKMTGR